MSDPRGSLANLFFVSKDPATQQLRYTDVSSGESFDALPRGGIALDRSTLLPYSASSEPEAVPTIVEIPQRISGFAPPEPTAAQPKPASRSSSVRDRHASFMPEDDSSLVLPADLKEGIHKFQTQDFARSFFNEQRQRTKVFAKKRLSIHSLTSFTSTPITSSLLSSLPDALETKAVQCFRWILHFSGAVPAKAPRVYADKLVGVLWESPPLRDELFFQLMRQTTECPELAWLRKTWELFLIVATCFPSTLNSEPWIKAHIARNIQHGDSFVAQYAQFTYIRFSSRCSIGKPMDISERDLVPFIPSQCQLCRLQFGASIAEQLWNQRRSYPKLLVPIVLVDMTLTLLEKHCERVEGIFRLPGNLKLVDQMTEVVNQGRGLHPNATVHDLASLLKRWFRDLPEPIVPFDTELEFQRAVETHTVFDFLQGIPKAHLNTLKYLIGFIQELLPHEGVTKMGTKNFAICFAPNIVMLKDATDLDKMQMFADLGIQFLVELIEHWDCTSLYPAPLYMLEKVD